jgi:T5SS/PEP-CTERM-associated repeat protein
VTVQNGATLRNSGTIGGTTTITSSGTLAGNGGTFGDVFIQGLGNLIGSNTAANTAVDGGSLNVTGSLQNTGDLTVGGTGSGNSLVITNGGTVANSFGFVGNDASSSNNSVLVTGAGSLWTNSRPLYVGNSGSGNSLVISNGGTVVVNSWSSIGNGAISSNNSVLVTGAGSRWTIGEVDVGYRGSGNSLVISNGGTVVAGNSFIGSGTASSNNSALVTGAGSLWTNSGTLIVGGSQFFGAAGGNSLTVADGGSISATSLTIAASNTSTGTLNIGRFGTNDAAGTINAPTIAFGLGIGAINFNQSNSTTLSAAISGNGTVNQLGAGTTILSVDNSYTGATTVSAGKLVVDGSISSSTVTVQGGTLGGSGTVGGLIVNTGGTISPGNSPGALNVAGNVVWNGGGNYNWQIHDTALIAGTGWDLVSATGSLDLSALAVGSEFKINLWSLSAVASDVNGPALNFNPNQNYTWTILTAGSGISGFTNSNQFLINIGATNGTGGFANALSGGSFSMAHDGNNLNLVFTSASAPIPEPGTWVAMAIFAGGAAYAGWRRRKSAKISE